MVFFIQRKVCRAIEAGDIPAFEALLQKGASLEMDIGDKSTPLYYAAEWGSGAMVDHLLGKGAVPDACVAGGTWTALHRAAYDGRIDIVVSLLKAGADPNLRADGSRTAFGLADSAKHGEIAQLLKPYMKNVRELFDLPKPPGPPEQHAAALPAAPAPATPAPAVDGWALLSPTDIARVAVDSRVGYRLTDIFNFGARERIRIICNLETKADTIETRAFDELQDKGQLEAAFRALKAAGGSADEASIDPLKKPSYPKPEPKNTP